MPQVHRITTNHGDVNFAGRDVNVQHHYHSYPDKVDITAVLGAIRNLRTIHLDNLSKATPGTGVWFLRSKMFLIWLDPNGNMKILWGTGIPGAGKTVLASIVIRELEARAAVEGSRVCVCYVYIRYSDRADLTVRNVLEILVKQTVERHSNCASLAEAAYARHVREKTQPTETELLQLLHKFTEVVAITFYFLDALDEAPDRIQVDLVQKLASLNVHLFITSRPLDAVQARAANPQCFPIIAQDGDLDLHISQEIARSRDLATLLEKEGTSPRNEIVSVIKSKCGGMFLHASLQLDALCECISAREVRQTLEAFPSKIEDVYHQTWRRILGQKASHVWTAKAFLVCVLNAAEPMTIEALERAVAMSPVTYKFESDRLVPGTTLIALCRGLVTLEEESRLVRLVHYTARDALQELLPNAFPHPHSHLINVCMSYLTECGFQDSMIRSEEDFNAALGTDPLLAYASKHWADHAKQTLDDEETRRRITTFVRESKAFPALNGRWYYDVLGPIHILVLYYFPMSLIAPDDIGDPNVVTQIQRRSALAIASDEGNITAAVSLLAHPKIEVNLVDDFGWTALVTASSGGDGEIVKLLLARPEIQVNLVGTGGNWSALEIACENGHENVVKLLLAHPETLANPEVNDESFALINAAHFGRNRIVKLLLAHPEFQVNLIDGDGYSALMLATRNRHAAAVRLLLAVPHIDTTIRSTDGHTAMSLALASGKRTIVQLLEEFEARRPRPQCSGDDLTLEELMSLYRGPFSMALEEPVDEEVGGEYESYDSEDYQRIFEEWLVEDVMMDVDTSGTKGQGTGDNLAQD